MAGPVPVFTAGSSRPRLYPAATLARSARMRRDPAHPHRHRV